MYNVTAIELRSGTSSKCLADLRPTSVFEGGDAFKALRIVVDGSRRGYDYVAHTLSTRSERDVWNRIEGLQSA